MRGLNLMGAFLLLALFGAPSFAMWSDRNEETFFDGFSWFPNQALLQLREFDFFPVKDRVRYVNRVSSFGESDPKYLGKEDFKKYEKLCKRFDEPSCRDDNYCERSNLFEFQNGVLEILKIKKMHREVVEIKDYNARRFNSLIGRIKKSSENGRDKLSYWAMRFREEDYSDMQKALKLAEELALAAICAKRDKNSTLKSIKKTSKMKKALGVKAK